eukprot:GGOE01040759.1.p1 GENE.GGOE01040759.1~~GGOE01040759.1.p1  ORF type:complete len:443 (+),score=48.18 GGOE01040759.1:74-1402(+)
MKLHNGVWLMANRCALVAHEMLAGWLTCVVKNFFSKWIFMLHYVCRIPFSRSVIFGRRKSSEAVEDVDTGDAENAMCSEAFLLPNGRIPPNVQRFGFHISYGALNGWVKQSSPVCAAASSAGAWNAVHGLHRGAPGAHDQHSVLAVMRDLLQEKIDSRRGKLERLWLQAPAGPLEIAVKEKLTESGLSLGGVSDGDKGATKADIWAAVQAVCYERAEGQHTEYRYQDGCFQALRSSWEWERQRSSDGAISICAPGRNRRATPADEEGTEDGQEDSGEEMAAKKEVLELFHGLAGMEKLTRPFPTTAVFGNWGILQAMRRLSDMASDHPILVQPFMGQRAEGTLPEVCISSQDSEAVIAEQWNRLAEGFKGRSRAFIFHLTNHYALLFALREWTTASGEEVREVLTTRQGQRPTVWMRWAECRSIMLQHSGYKILSVRGLLMR